MKSDDYYDRKAEQSTQQAPTIYWFALGVFCVMLVYVVTTKMMGN